MMGSRIAIPLEDEELTTIQQETGFSKSQIRDLYSRFLSLSKDGGESIRRSDLIRLSELKSNPLGSRIVEAFFKDACSDDETMDFTQFVKSSAVFKPQRKHRPESALNSRESKMKFIFNIYDLDGNESVSHEEMGSLLRMLVGSEVTDETIHQIAERAVIEGDDDQDGTIDFVDFKKALSKIEAENLISIRFLD